MSMAPTSVASGMRLMTGTPTSTNASRRSAAVTPERRCRVPAPIFIMLWPIIAQPPIVPNAPAVTFASPWATHPLFGRPRVSVIAAIRFSVISDSIRPMAACAAEIRGM
jgi:hypothetical protein